MLNMMNTGLRKVKKSNSSNNSQVTIAIIDVLIPCYNEKYLPVLFESLNQLKIPPVIKVQFISLITQVTVELVSF